MPRYRKCTYHEKWFPVYCQWMECVRLSALNVTLICGLFSICDPVVRIIAHLYEKDGQSKTPIQSASPNLVRLSITTFINVYSARVGRGFQRVWKISNKRRLEYLHCSFCLRVRRQTIDLIRRQSFVKMVNPTISAANFSDVIADLIEERFQKYGKFVVQEKSVLEFTG